MVRVKKRRTSSKRKFFKRFAKGYSRGNTLAVLAKEQTFQSLNYSYKNRRLLKRNFRSLWIQRLKSILIINNCTYNYFISKLRALYILLNRKILSYLCFFDSRLLTFLINFKS
jgi:large subunit ribosomal protein L20